MSQRQRRQVLTLAAVLSLTLCGAVIGTQSVDKQADGVIKVDMGDVFERGVTKIEEADLGKLPSLPQGFVPLNGKAYRITTEAVATGPYRVVIKVSSVSDEQAFKNLRVLHVEPDEFDPDNGVWIDRTVSNPNEPSHDLRQKTITAYSNELHDGIYTIARSVPKIEANADLEVTAKGSPESVQLPGNLTFLVAVKNNGPDVATNVGAHMDQSRFGGYLVSESASQGTCKYNPRGVYCKLGRLAAGASATVKIVIEPRTDYWGEYESIIRVGGNEKDNKPENNETVGTVLLLKDPNVPPEVALHGLGGDLFEQGATVLLQATASDPDGSIAKVEFFDNYESIGIGTSTDARHFSLRSSPLSNGRHRFQAVATDNGGRSTTVDYLSIFVNGPIQVRIVEPKAESVIAPGSDLTLTAEATHPSGSIRTVEFFTNGISLGQTTPIEDNRFTLKLRDIKRAKYPLEAVATDESGLVSKSRLELKVSYQPTIRIATPSDSTTLKAPVNIELILNPESAEYGRLVEIYANDVLIQQGSVILPGRYAFTWRDVKAGKYVLKAVVFDVVGVRGESSPVNIVIKNRNMKNQ